MHIQLFMKIGVKTSILSFIAVLVCLTPSPITACELNFSCDNVQKIDVAMSEWRSPETGLFRTVYVVYVIADAAKIHVEKTIKKCTHGSVTMRAGDTILLEHKTKSHPVGSWFSFFRETPEEALDAANAICPKKVISHLPGLN